MALGTARTERRSLVARWPACTIDDAWVAIAALVPFVATALGSSPSGDFAYLVRSGDLMLRTHTVLRADVFTYTIPGHAWVNQQWGAALLLAIVHGVGGWGALAVVRSVVDVLSFRLVYLASLRRSGDRATSARLTIVGFVVTATFAGTLAARAQMFAIPLFAIAVAIVLGRHEHPSRLWALPLVTVAWANLHGSFFLPAVLLGCAIAGDAIERRHVDLRQVGVLAACVLAAGVGPFGFSVYRYVASLRSDPVVANLVDEWRPLSVVSVAGAAFAVATLAIVVGIVRRRLVFTRADLLTLIALSALAIWTGRSIVWWGLGAPPLVAAALARGKGRPAVDPETRREAERPATVLVAALVVLSLAAGVHAATAGRAFVSDAPPGITRFLADRVDPSERIFDGWWGSWFEYALPGRPMFVDARAELFPVSVWNDYFAISHARRGWAERLDRWHVDVVVAASEYQTALMAAMRSSDEWRQAYADADGSVFVRT